MMKSDRYSKMCLSRCLVLLLIAPVIVHSVEWKGKWFPENPHLRKNSTPVVAEVPETAAAPEVPAVPEVAFVPEKIPASEVPTKPEVLTVPEDAAPSKVTASPEVSSTPEISSSTPVPSTTAAPLPLSTENPSLLEKTRLPEIDQWTGKWFPNDPSAKPTSPSSLSTTTMTPMGIVDKECDNAKDNLQTDFDPTNLMDSVIYVCLGNKHLYNPNVTIEPILKEHQISPAYRPLHKCMNAEIKYEAGIPTFGDHRPLWARYGEYKYVPPQRWLHNIEHGAIVMLYHPCANFNQITQLRMLVTSCLYRHIITPSSELLTPERPLALVAWGKSLEMSVVVPEIVIKFIKENALKGPEQTFHNGQYEKLILFRADIVSTIDDSVLCPNMAEVRP